MRIYFVRHGESVGNSREPGEAIVASERDGLTDLGKKQARNLGKRLSHAGLTHIVTSPYRRAKETAEGINEVLQLPVTVNDDAHEVRQSDAFYAAAPKDCDSLRYLTWIPKHPQDPGYAPPGAESFNDVAKRVALVQDYLVKHAAEKNILLVTHNGFTRWFLGRVLFQEAFEPKKLPFLRRIFTSNTGISIFDYDNRFPEIPGWRLLTWNDQEHV